MAGLGFRYPIGQSPRPALGDPLQVLQRRYYEPQTLPDGRVGYAFAEDTGPIDESSAALDLESAEFIDALIGSTVVASANVVDLNGNVVATNTVSDGCLGTATLAVHNSSDEYLSFVTALNRSEVVGSASFNEMTTSDDFIAVSDRWANCMMGLRMMNAAQGSSFHGAVLARGIT